MVDSWIKRSDGTTVWGSRPGVATATASWTEADRPSAPFAGQTGYNTTFKSIETYDGTKWKILSGAWTTATRPVGVASGSMGLNTDTGYGIETLNGTVWQLL